MATVNDLEIQWLLANAGDPRDGFNDLWFDWLGSRGFTGNWNDRWFNYLGSLGITGALNDRLREAFCNNLFNGGGVTPPPQSNWILESGSWADTGVWIDSETWRDS